MRLARVNTGYCYLRDIATGSIVKAILPAGFHPVADGWELVEVLDRAGLDAIQDNPPVIEETEDQKVRRLIQAELEKLALERLKAAGKVRNDYGNRTEKDQ